MAATLPDHFTMRPAAMDDLEDAVAMFNACAVESVGRPKFDVHDVRSEWLSPSLNLETDTRVVVSPEGEIVGYVEVWDQEPHVRIWSFGLVHPDCRGRGIGTVLLQWAEDRARRATLKAPSGARVTLTQDALSTDTAARELLEQQGFRIVRHSFRMIIEMGGPPPEPVVPEGITVRTLVPGEERPLIRAIEEAFRDHWGYVERPFEQIYEDWIHWIENNPHHDPSLWFVAVDGEEIAGASLCRAWRVEDPELGWVDSLGVRRPWRRRGLALALLLQSFAELYRRGKRKVGLGVDAQSLTGATRLYEKAGMHVEREYLDYEKELRPGEELRTQSLEGVE